jgi:hypothetical protein
MQRFLERDHNVGFDIGPALSRGLTPAKFSERRAAVAAAKNRLEEIAETSAAELKLDPAILAAPLMKSAAGLLRFPLLPAGRRLKSAWPVPIGAQLIVFLALLRIAQDFVGFIDLLKLFLGSFFVPGDVRMIFAREFAKRAADFLSAGRFRHAERFVVIAKLDRHGLSSLCCRSIRATFSMQMRDLGKFIVLLGVITTLVGLILWSGVAPKWLGRLPGDIRIEREHSTFYFPIVTCILLSILLSLLLSILAIFRR